MERSIKHAWEIDKRINPDKICGNCFYPIKGIAHPSKDPNKGVMRFKNLCEKCFQKFK